MKLVSDIIVEKLLEQRNFYLNTLKHLDFELLMELSQKDIENIEKIQTNTIEQLKKVEQEIAFISNSK